MAKQGKPISWLQLCVAFTVLAVILQAIPFLQGWVSTTFPKHEGWLHQGISLFITVPLWIVVSMLVLEACGAKVDWSPWKRDRADADPVTRNRRRQRRRLRTFGLLGLGGILFFLDWLRYSLAIDQHPLANQLYNAFIGVVGGAAYAGGLILDRRRHKQAGAPAGGD